MCLVFLLPIASTLVSHPEKEMLSACRGRKEHSCVFPLYSHLSAMLHSNAGGVGFSHISNSLTQAGVL